MSSFFIQIASLSTKKKEVLIYKLNEHSWDKFFCLQCFVGWLFFFFLIFLNSRKLYSLLFLKFLLLQVSIKMQLDSLRPEKSFFHATNICLQSNP